MDLFVRDYEILAAYQDRGEEPINRTARVTSFKSHTVRRTIIKALESGVLTRKAFINVHDLGLQQYAALLRFEISSAEQHSCLYECLAKLESVELALKLEPTSEYQYYAIITAKSSSNLETILSSISQAGKTRLVKTRLQTRRGYCYFGAKYLGSLRTPAPIEVTFSDRRISLPSEDLAVIDVFSANAHGVRTQMARTLGMPLMTLQYRIERLERLGVIEGVRYHIDATALGHLQFRCMVVAKLPLESQRKKLTEWARSHRYIVAVMDGAGSWDYELWLETPTTLGAQAVIEEMLSRFSSIIHSTELIQVESAIKITSRARYSSTIKRHSPLPGTVAS